MVCDPIKIERNGPEFYRLAHAESEFAWVYNYPSLTVMLNYVSKVSIPFKVIRAYRCVKMGAYLKVVD